MIEWIVGLTALTAMEIVLGIDNIVFITIVSAKLPKKQQPLARRLGLALALLTRLGLLWLLFTIVHGQVFDRPIFKLTDVGVPKAAIVQMSGAAERATRHHNENETDEESGTGSTSENGGVGGSKEDGDSSATESGTGKLVVNQSHYEQANEISLKDLILFLGGLFLLGKSVWEIHDELGAKGEHEVSSSKKLFVGVLVQIALLDIVFSLDSVITAVGMVDELWVMIVAIVLAVIVMLIFSEPISRFVDTHPTLKILALSFLILIGVMLIAEGVGAHMDKGYIYFAMSFALLVEILNIRLRGKANPAPSSDSSQAVTA